MTVIIYITIYYKKNYLIYLVKDYILLFRSFIKALSLLKDKFHIFSSCEDGI